MAITISQFVSSTSSRSPLAQSNGSSPLSARQSIRQESASTEELNTVESIAANQQEAAKRESTSALLKLNNAQSYIDVAKNAATQIDTLLQAAEEGAKTLQTSLSEEDRAAVEFEMFQIGNEIDNIVENASFNGQQVLEAGSTTFSGTLNAADNSSGSSFSITISNLGLSTNSLSYSALRPDLDDPETFEETITAARLSVNSEITKLEDAEDQIGEIAERAGLNGSAAVAAEAQALTPVAVQETLAQATAEQLVNASANLNPARVNDLLVEDRATESSNGRGDSEESGEGEEANRSEESDQETVLERVRASREESEDEE